MSVQAIGWVLEHSSTRFGARLILLSIANHAKADGTGAWPSYETMAQEAGTTRRHAIRVVLQLETEGHLTIDRNAGPKGTNLYSIVPLASDNMSLPSKMSPLVTNTKLVTSKPPASDISSTEGVTDVTRTVIEPSQGQPYHPSPPPSANGRERLSAEQRGQRVALKNVLVEVCGWDTKSMTRDAWGEVERTAKQLHEASARPPLVRGFLQQWEATYPDVGPLRPQTIASHWPEYMGGSLKREVSRARRR